MVLCEVNEKKKIEAAQVLFLEYLSYSCQGRCALSYARIVEACLCICVSFFIIRKLLISGRLMAQEESRPVLYAFGAVG